MASLVPKYLETPGSAASLRLVSERLQLDRPLSPAQVEQKRQAQEGTAGRLSVMLSVLKDWECLPEAERLQESWTVHDRLTRIFWGIQC
jgi:hypothetical protein